jgi:hypothetical protein
MKQRRFVLALGLAIAGPACKRDQTPQPSPRSQSEASAQQAIAAAAKTTTSLEQAKQWLGEHATLVHVAGIGGELPDGESAWKSEYEDSLALEVGLSQPYTAGEDASGSVYIADKNGQAIRKVTSDGRLITWAGTGVAGNGADEPGPAKDRALAFPNGLVVRPDGTLYVLDRDNGKVRKVSSEGTLTTLAQYGQKFESGRGLAVSDDEKTIFVANKENVLRWHQGEGFQVFAEGFSSVANLVLRSDGSLIVADRGANLVFAVDASGHSKVLAGNGDTKPVADGLAASALGLAGPRGVAQITENSWLVATQDGRDVFFFGADQSGVRLIDGREGKGLLPTAPGLLGPIRGITLTPNGDLLITHGNGGQVHRLERKTARTTAG